MAGCRQALPIRFCPCTCVLHQWWAYARAAISQTASRVDWRSRKASRLLLRPSGMSELANYGGQRLCVECGLRKKEAFKSLSLPRPSLSSLIQHLYRCPTSA